MAEMTLEERAREERREYFRQWRAKNPDKVRENNRRYWEKRAAKKAAEKEREAGYYEMSEEPLKPWDSVELEIMVRKNRHGGIGSCSAGFFPATGKIIRSA